MARGGGERGVENNVNSMGWKISRVRIGELSECTRKLENVSIDICRKKDIHSRYLWSRESVTEIGYF